MKKRENYCCVYVKIKGEFKQTFTTFKFGVTNRNKTNKDRNIYFTLYIHTLHYTVREYKKMLSYI